MDAGQEQHHDHGAASPVETEAERRARIRAANVAAEAEMPSGAMRTADALAERAREELARVAEAWRRARGKGVAVGPEDYEFLRRAVAEHGTERVLAKIASVVRHNTRGVSMAYLETALTSPDNRPQAPETRPPGWRVLDDDDDEPPVMSAPPIWEVQAARERRGAQE